jgi:DNA-binding transcriptional LysR family regulator
MDKLRAIEYFSRAVQTGTFAATAREFDVSTPAVTQLIAALERSLGTSLFHRSNRGLQLTADGERYYAMAKPVLEMVQAVEQTLTPSGARPRGTLTVGMRVGLAQHLIMPRLREFLERYPDIELVLKQVERLNELDAQNVDVALMSGWPPDRDFVVTPLAQNRNVVCASPDYWARNGKPLVPEDLLGHACLVMESSSGALLDRWLFAKNGEQRAVDVPSRVFSHQITWIHEAACAGAGVIRVADLPIDQYLAAGLLEPALTDWEALEAPLHFALYRPTQRRSKRVRAFVDFAAEVYRDVAAARATGGSARRMPRPEWFGRAHGKHSSYAARRPA